MVCNLLVRKFCSGNVTPQMEMKDLSNYDNDIEAVLAANVAVICTRKEVCDSNFLTLQDHSFHFHLA